MHRRSGALPGHHRSKQGYKFFTRIFQFNQMDFEVALYQMVYLCFSPQKVYRNVQYRKSTKNQWARDDPAFLVLLAAFLTVSSIICAFAFGLGFAQLLRLILWVVFVDFLGSGILVSTTLWAVTNKFLKAAPLAHTVDQSVDWSYAFDVHCNAFFPLLMLIHVIQLVILKVIAQPWFLSALLANTLWLVALTYYIYVTFLGYSALPFLKNTGVLLYGVLLVVAGYIGFTVTRTNLSLVVFEYYGFNPSQQ
eukprot:m.43784 g.43784  ORF g.43784 m.43784 type:complete len:250 (-) comp10795_c1_seq2:1240-1989(-)